MSDYRLTKLKESIKEGKLKRQRDEESDNVIIETIINSAENKIWSKVNTCASDGLFITEITFKELFNPDNFSELNKTPTFFMNLLTKKMATYKYIKIMLNTSTIRVDWSEL